MPEHKMTIRIEKDLHKAAKLKAVESEVTLSEVMREFLRLWVEDEIELRQEDEPPKSD